jgi:hypothetical protein
VKNWHQGEQLTSIFIAGFHEVLLGTNLSLDWSRNYALDSDLAGKMSKVEETRDRPQKHKLICVSNNTLLLPKPRQQKAISREGVN